MAKTHLGNIQNTIYPTDLGYNRKEVDAVNKQRRMFDNTVFNQFHAVRSSYILVANLIGYFNAKWSYAPQEVLEYELLHNDEG